MSWGCFGGICQRTVKETVMVFEFGILKVSFGKGFLRKEQAKKSWGPLNLESQRFLSEKAFCAKNVQRNLGASELGVSEVSFGNDVLRKERAKKSWEFLSLGSQRFLSETTCCAKNGQRNHKLDGSASQFGK